MTAVLRAILVVLGAAVLQGMTVIGDPVPTGDAMFTLRVLTLFVILVGMLTALSALTAGAPVLAIPVAIVGCHRGIRGSAGRFRRWGLPGSGCSTGPHRRHVLVMAVLGALGWVVALVLGFFVTGVIALIASWTCFGVIAAGVISHCPWRRRAGTAVID